MCVAAAAASVTSNTGVNVMQNYIPPYFYEDLRLRIIIDTSKYY